MTDLAERLAASLSPPVERRETHGAWVLLSGDRALKLRKPVRLDFLDYSTVERRLEAARAEVALNRDLAPGIYRGVRALVAVSDGVRLGPWGTVPEAIDHVVEMRRFDERATMAARVADDSLSVAQVTAAAARIARFHAGASRCRATAPGARPDRDLGGAAAFAARVTRDLDEVARLAGGPDALAADRAFARAALDRRRPELDARAARGLRRDGHGDLRAEHVVLETRGPLIVDRLEFDPGLRCADVGSDLAFLAMDVEALGAAWAADALVAAYQDAGGDPGSAPLRALFAWQRALVRRKVALVRGDAEAARQLAELEDRCAWRERLPAVVLVMGPPASGKSTLAAALADATGRAVVSTDAVRKELHGVAATARLGAAAYGERVTERVYAAVAERAAAAVERTGGAIVDATARSASLRRILLERLRGEGVVAVVCTAAPDELARRARARLGDADRVSDADPAVAGALAEAFEPPSSDEAGFARVVSVRTDRPAPLATVAAALDGGGLGDGHALVAPA